MVKTAGDEVMIFSEGYEVLLRHESIYLMASCLIAYGSLVTYTLISDIILEFVDSIESVPL